MVYYLKLASDREHAISIKEGTSNICSVGNLEAHLTWKHCYEDICVTYSSVCAVWLFWWNQTRWIPATEPVDFQLHGHLMHSENKEVVCLPILSFNYYYKAGCCVVVLASGCRVGFDWVTLMLYNANFVRSLLYLNYFFWVCWTLILPFF